MDRPHVDRLPNDSSFFASQLCFVFREARSGFMDVILVQMGLGELACRSRPGQCWHQVTTAGIVNIIVHEIERKKKCMCNLCR